MFARAAAGVIGNAKAGKMHPIVDDVGTIKQWAGIPNIWRLCAGVTKGIDHREKILQQAARIRTLVTP